MKIDRTDAAEVVGSVAIVSGVAGYDVRIAAIVGGVLAVAWAFLAGISS